MKFQIEIITKIFVRITFSIIALTYSHISVCQSSILDSLYTEYKKGGDKKVDVLLKIGEELMRVDLDSAQLIFSQVYAESLTQRQKLKSQLNIGKCHTYLGQYESADSIFQLVKIQLDFDDYEFQTTLINSQGINKFYKGSYSEAGEYFEQFYTLAVKENNQEDISRSVNNLGLIYKYAGLYDKAMEWLLRSVKIDEETGNDKTLAQGFNNIALLQSDMGNSELAKQYYFKSLRIKLKYGDEMSLYSAYQNLGNLYKNSNQIDSARLFLNKAKLIASKLEYSKGLLDTYSALTVLFNKTKNYDSAKYFAENALQVALKTKDNEGLAATSINYGDVLRHLKEYTISEKYLKQGLELSIQIKNKDFTNEAFLILSELHASIGNFQDAYFYLSEHKTLSDSLLNRNNFKQVAELQTKYETEKKEQQIALQQAQISEQQTQNKLNIAIIIGLIFTVISLGIIVILIRSRAQKKQTFLLQEAEIKLREAQLEAAINSQETERSRFARDLHDGFGQMISILNLNLKSLEKGETDRHEIFEQSTHVLDEMYQELKGICFNLMPQTLIKSGIEAAIREFAARVNQTEKLFVETDFFGLEERLTEMQEISLYRITQEWINNILKYSDATKVTVQITKDEEELTLLIEDNGLGFDLELIKNGKGNGWRNMNSRANLIKGVLELDTTSGVRGNTLVINAPVKAQYLVTTT